MIKINKTIKSFVLVASLAFIVMACETKSTRYESNDDVKTSKNAETIRQNISDMRQKAWDKSAYTEILNEQIKNSSSDENTRRGLTAELNVAYAEVMVRDGKQIMEQSCSSNHQKLGQLMTELEAFVNSKKAAAPGAQELIGKYQKHKEMEKLVEKLNARQHVGSFRDSYQEGFTTADKQKAGQYVAATTCSFLKSKLSSQAINQAVNEKKNAYCDAVVKAYCNRNTEWSQSDENVVKNNLQKVGGLTAARKDRIEQYSVNH